MLRYLLNHAKKVLTMLLVAAMFMSSVMTSNANEVVTVSFTGPKTKVEETVPAWMQRECDVIIRVGEYNGKAGKRVYIDDLNISWKNIPTDIPIHRDNQGHYISEYDINLRVANKIYKQLIADGVNAKLQIAGGKSEDLNAAARISNESNPKLYLSIHHNYYNSTSSGYFTMYNQDNSTAKAIAGRLSNCIKDNNRVRYTGDRANDGYIGELNNIHNSTIGVLMELGFFSNPQELQTIINDSHTDYISNKLADEVENILNDYWK